MFPLYTLENCIACGVCAKACKRGAISIDVETKFDGRRFLKAFYIDYSKCDECLECVKKCRKGTIVGVEGEKPEGVYDLKDLIELKRRLGLKSKIRTSFVDECFGCLFCFITCPVGAVNYEDRDGVRMVWIEECEGCGMCVRNCPNYALDLVEVNG